MTRSASSSLSFDAVVAGDAGPGPQSLPTAAASGTVAGAMLNHDLLSEAFAR